MSVTRKKSARKYSAYSVILDYKKTQNSTSYDSILKQLSQRTTKTSVETLNQWFMQLRDCANLLDKTCEKVVIDTLLLDWENEDDIDYIHDLVITLVIGNNYFLAPILECLLQKLFTTISKENEEQLQLDPFSFGEAKLNSNDKIIDLVCSIIKAVPLSDHVLLNSILKLSPYIKKHVHIHITFIYYSLVFSQLLPTLRKQIFEIVLTGIIKLDIVSPRTELLDAEDDEENSDCEQEDDLFYMEIDNKKSCKLPSTSHSTGHTLDMIMTLMFKYVHLICHGGKNLRLLLNNSLHIEVEGCMSGSAFKSGDEVNTNGCPCNGSKHDFKGLKSLYLVLKDTFLTCILPTYSIAHAQFILFYILSLRPSLVSDFIDFLKDLFGSFSERAKEERKTAIAYLGSILARGKFVKFSHIHYCLELLSNWCKNYLSSEFVQNHKYEDIQAHSQFYCACQSIFYVFTFNYKDYIETKSRNFGRWIYNFLTERKQKVLVHGTESNEIDVESSVPQGLRLARSLNLEELVTCPLNPLRYCNPTIAINFAAVTNHYQLAYCYSIIEYNSRLFLPMALQNAEGVIERQNSSLEMYFPFDPYLLKRSECFITENYNEFEGLPDEITRDVTEVKEPIRIENCDDVADDSLLWKASFSSDFEMSPGF